MAPGPRLSSLFVPSTPLSLPPIDRDYFRDLFGAGRLFEGALILNLDDRPERLRYSLAELEPFGLDTCVQRMSAFRHEHGMYGCSVSHVEAVRYARWKGWKSVVIFEDDIRLTRHFAEHAPRTLHDLAEREWSIFQFGYMIQYSNVQFVTPNLFRYRGGQGAHAFALHERIYDTLLDGYVCELDRGNWGVEQHLPFDEYLNNELSFDCEAYGAGKLLVSQHPGLSQTSGREVDYRDMIEELYEKLSPDAPHS